MISIWASILSVAHGAIAETTVELSDPELFANGEVTRFLDCGINANAELKFDIKNNIMDGDVIPPEVIARVEIDIDEVQNAAVYDIAANTQECIIQIEVFNELNLQFLLQFSQSSIE